MWRHLPVQTVVYLRHNGSVLAAIWARKLEAVDRSLALS